MPIELNEVGLRIFTNMRDGEHEAANEFVNRKEDAFIKAILRPLVLDFCARKMLETPGLRDHLCLGASVPDVKAHEVNQARRRLGLPIINPA